MDVVGAFVVGAAVGWVLALRRRRHLAPAKPEPTPARQPGRYRPTKRQREILASLPPDPVPPTLEDLVAEEASALGVDRIPAPPEVPLHILLVVWKRDRPLLGDCPEPQLQFVTDAASSGASAAENVKLVCDPSRAPAEER